MELLPTQDEVLRILRDTGALRDGHFEYPTGLHTNEYLQVPLALRYYQNTKTLGVSLSRLLRANPEIRAIASQLSIVSPTTGGVPLAFSMCEALRAHQVYWLERPDDTHPMRLRQYLEPIPNEPVVMVDDVLRSGRKFRELKDLLEAGGAHVVGLAAVIFQPTPQMVDLGDIPRYYLAQINPTYYTDAAECALCREGVPLEKVWI
ncbi:MAG: phosphoribosyltransferase [Bryobacterales bacterium]|nr:phosphoribosyltransferase [Bryobacterales bacterium]